MATDPVSVRIIADSNILAGKPIIAGTRISVQLVLEKIRDGWTIEDLLDDYPHLTREQIIAALEYAAEIPGSFTVVSPTGVRIRILP
jgi:uncharacterized protein (DUF433 family)